VSAIHERLVQRYSEEFGLGAEGQGFVVEVDFQLTFSFLLVKVEDCRHRFCSAELSFRVRRYSLIIAMSLVSTPSTASQSPSPRMIARLSAYAYFLEMVVGKSEM